MRLAVTGASGFIGRHLIEKLHAAGHKVNILLRGESDIKADRTIIGDLNQSSCIHSLIDGADVIFHVAGLVRAVNLDDFDRVNRDGTDLVARIAAEHGCRMILVSSLAARHPKCSRYAASKFAGELAAAKHMKQQDLTILRPPAVYGPGDIVTMPIFQQIENGWMVMPAAANARFSMIFVDDLVELLEKSLQMRATEEPIEPDDGKDQGYSWSDIQTIGERISGKKIRFLRLPRPLISFLSIFADLAASTLSRPMLLSGDKVGELYHPNWVARGNTPSNWHPKTDFALGGRQTLSWYRDHNWMKPR